MRKTMLRRALLLLLVFVCLFTMTGCHSGRTMEVSTVPYTFNDSKQIEITFWAKNDTNVTQTRVYEQAIADFEALYPNVKVNLRLYTDYLKIYNDVITNISTDTTPNVCITYPDHIATYMTGTNVVVNLDQYANDPRFGFGGSELRFDGPDADELIEQYMSECRFDGSLYALPYMRSTEACFINKTYVEALGYTVPDVLTWDFIWEVSEAALEKDEQGLYKVNGQKVLIPFIYKSTDNMMITMLAQKNAGYSTAEGEVQIFNDTTRELLVEIGEHGASRAFSTFKISSYPANFLVAGQCIFAIDSTAGSTWMGSDAPLCDIDDKNRIGFETVVRTVPQYNTEEPLMISQGPSVCVFNKNDPDVVLASWLFAQYLMTNEVQLPYAETEGYVPVTKKAQQSEAYQDYLSRSGEDNDLHYSVKIEATQLLLANIDNTFTTAVFNGSASLREAAGQLIESVVKSRRRKQVVDDAYLDQLFSDTTSLYHLDQISVDGTVNKEEGPLPTEAVVLLCTLALVWLTLGGVFLHGKLKQAKKRDS